MIPPSKNKHRVLLIFWSVAISSQPWASVHRRVLTKCGGSHCWTGEAVTGITMWFTQRTPRCPDAPWPRARRRSPVSWCRLATESSPPARWSVMPQATTVLGAPHPRCEEVRGSPESPWQDSPREAELWSSQWGRRPRATRPVRLSPQGKRGGTLLPLSCGRNRGATCCD